METQRNTRLNDSITSPRLLDTTLCPFSTTKKSIAHTYNNESLYIASMEKQYQQSNITQCRSKLKIRKLILDTVSESIKQPTRRLLSRVGEDQHVLDCLLKFYKSVVPVINKLQSEIDRQIQQNKKLRLLFSNPKSQRSVALQVSSSKQNQLQFKVQKLEATLNQIINEQVEIAPTQKGRISFGRGLQNSLQLQKKSLIQALQQVAKLKQEKQNYFYMINNFKLQIQRLKEQNKRKEVEVPSNFKINEDFETLKQEVEQLKRYRQLFHMCRQEKDYILGCQSIDNARARQNQKQIRKLKEKLLNLSSLIGRGDFQLLQNQERDIIEKIKDEIINNIGFKKCTQQQFKMLQQYQSIIESPEQSENKYHDELKIYYPTFFNLLTEEIKQFEVELKISFNKTVTSDLFLRIRGIMDSKYNQLIIESESGYSRFTDFVFGWFQKFDVNSQIKRIVQHNKPRIQSEYNKKHFLIGLFNPKIEKLNEILTFRQFLLGQSPQDQVFYYLHCRSMFFKGCQLDHVSSASDTIVFLHHDHVLKQVGVVISKYPKQIQNIMIYNINLRRKKKFNGYFIDVAFVLRTLLQVYRAFKRQKYQKMKLVIMKLQNTLGTKQIKFVYFRQLIQLNFPKMTISKLSYMYRQTINIYRNNKIDFFGAFYAASHQKLFIYTIKEDLYNSQIVEGRSLINISATLPSTLGLQALNEDLKCYFGSGINQMYSQNVLLSKIVRLLAHKQQNKQYLSTVKQKLKLSYQSNLRDAKIMTENMKARDSNIHKAALRLSRAFRYKIKLYYDKFLQKINNKIQEVNKITAK